VEVAVVVRGRCDAQTINMQRGWVGGWVAHEAAPASTGTGERGTGAGRCRGGNDEEEDGERLGRWRNGRLLSS